MSSSVLYRLVPVWLALLSLLSSCAAYDHFFHPHRLGSPPMTAAAKAKARAAEKARHKGLTLGAPATDGDKTSASTPDISAASGSSDGASAPTPAPAADTPSADDKNKAIEDMLGNTYNTKTGLLKRSRLQRMQYSSRQLHHYNLHTPPHTDATRDSRHMRKHAKGPGKTKDAKATDIQAQETAAEAAASGLTPDPTQPAAPKATPAKPAPKPAKAPASKPAPKPKADKEAASKTKADKLSLAGEQAAKPKKSPKADKPKKDKHAPKPDPTQPPPSQD